MSPFLSVPRRQLRVHPVRFLGGYPGGRLCRRGHPDLLGGRGLRGAQVPAREDVLRCAQVGAVGAGQGRQPAEPSHEPEAHSTADPEQAAHSADPAAHATGGRLLPAHADRHDV